ncbi:family 43 glycosylhydrolase [Catenovulum adriaticum]|uniref:Family 43 glycosylhydrolase n=1 Tax=Catenovulum adriaticum TaxID=2984846 RepID=A0ABY7ASX5_9ALTE|nr:family 43 glycosylhydrolase [Catenovulum sp. TS8]WAJ71776.1 family 43 glycosylhydrolase [Catenovulum sp. TS8]
MKLHTITKNVLAALGLVGLVASVQAAQLKVSDIRIDGQKQQVSKKVKHQSQAQLLLAEERASYQVSAEIKLNDSGRAGLIFRSFAGQPGYTTGLDTAKQSVFLATTDKTITEKNFKVDKNKWYKLKLLVRNNHFVLYIDDQVIRSDAYPMYDAVDNSYSSGQLGLFSTSDDAQIRNVEVTDYQPKNELVTYTNPVQLNCADPGLLTYQSTYYAYCTYTPDFPMMRRGIRLYTSKDLVNWQDQGFVLKNEDSWGTSRHWAPDVVEKDGKFYMYYAVDERIAVATSDSPMGPFVQKVQQPMQPDSIKIDAHVFTDDDGKRYFYYVSFDNGNHLWGAELNDDMMSVKQSTMTHLIAPVEPWETHMANVAEGAVVIKHKGYYYMTYSGSHFESPHYSIGYAVAEHPLGPWKKYSGNPIMKSTTYAHGTAHHSLAKSPDGKEWFVVYHQHYSLTQTEPRKISIDRMRFVPLTNGPDILQTWGPTVTPQPLPSGVVEQ